MPSLPASVVTMIWNSPRMNAEPNLVAVPWRLAAGVHAGT